MRGKPVQTIIACRKENEKLKAENQVLRAKVKEASKDANIVFLEHIREMCDLIGRQSERLAELESQLRAARKVSLSAMELLSRRSKRTKGIGIVPNPSHGEQEQHAKVY